MSARSAFASLESDFSPEPERSARGGIERPHRGDPDCFSIQESAISAGRPAGEVHGRQVDHSHDRFTLLFECNEDAVSRNAAQIGTGAVERIHDPPTLAPRPRPRLFAEESIRWERFEQPIADQRFAGAINSGNGRGVGLSFGCGKFFHEWSCNSPASLAASRASASSRLLIHGRTSFGVGRRCHRSSRAGLECSNIR